MYITCNFLKSIVLGDLGLSEDLILPIVKYLYLSFDTKLDVNCNYESFYLEQPNLNVRKIDVFQLASKLKYVQAISF